MTPEVIKEIVESVIDQKFEYYNFYLLASIVISAVIVYFTSYLKTKSKNLATIEDIEKITSKVESVKQEYKKEFGLIKSQNDLHFSELKNTKDRYNSKQFEIYNNLWTSLIELKFSADDLWDEANQKNLKNFSTKISLAKRSIEVSSLLLENNDYSELKTLLEEFNNFEFNKGELIKLYKIKDKTYTFMDKNYINEHTIQRMIIKNGQIKESYDALIIKLKEKFKAKIKGEK